MAKRRFINRVALSFRNRLSSPASGGAEVYVKDLVLELKRLGHDVFIGFLEHAADT